MTPDLECALKVVDTSRKLALVRKTCKNLQKGGLRSQEEMAQCSAGLAEAALTQHEYDSEGIYDLSNKIN
ncbi:hypothetical protein E2C01_075186 [Portunus trituberculatus]|uniref:Uncharacterized protein n=1 Tax=Portunus trituberculatus TaxID=210409 RepID=A0A5B7IED0_PORTR|nr:hypothetical protein [Portunus trituberculatus]